MKRGTWAEINLDNIKNNLYSLKKRLNNTTKICCDVVGRICMDQCMIKVPHNLDISIEDDVLVISDEDDIRVEDLAQKCGTINYEVLCSISRRVARHYYKEGSLFKIVSYL